MDIIIVLLVLILLVAMFRPRSRHPTELRGWAGLVSRPCPNCRVNIRNSAKFCPHCGQPTGR